MRALKSVDLPTAGWGFHLRKRVLKVVSRKSIHPQTRQSILYYSLLILNSEPLGGTAGQADDASLHLASLVLYSRYRS